MAEINDSTPLTVSLKREMGLIQSTKNADCKVRQYVSSKLKIS